jgi:hypothetical protein
MSQPESPESVSAEETPPTVAPAYSTPPPEGLPDADDDQPS